MDTLRYRFETVDITPVESVILAGYSNRTGMSGPVHRPLSSRCLALRSGETTVCLVVNDFMNADRELIDRLREEISSRTGCAQSHILISSIHTHSSPLLERGFHRANDRYIEYAGERIVRNAVSVLGDDGAFRPGRLRTGSAVSPISAKRKLVTAGDGSIIRIPDLDAPCDHEVQILEIADERSNPAVTLCNYACHPVTLGFNSVAVSPDYPGRMRELVESVRGGAVIFLTGVSGDINPLETDHTDTAVTDREGEKLGRAVLSAKMREYEGPVALRLATGEIRLPFRDTGITREHVDAEVLRKSIEVTEFRDWKEHLKGWRAEMHSRIEAGETSDSFTVGVAALRIGPAVLFFVQGELFVQYQLDLKRRFPGVRLLCVGYTYGEGGYIPTADEFPKKGYETDQAYIYMHLPSPYSPVVEEIFRAGAERLIASVL